MPFSKPFLHLLCDQRTCLIASNLTIDKTGGTLTIVNVGYYTKTLTYISGTVTCTGTLTTTIGTFDTGGMTWKNVTIPNSSSTITILSDWNISDTFYANGTSAGNTVTVNGAGKIINVGGNITTGSAAGVRGTAKIVLNGTTNDCTWSGAGYIENSMEINKTTKNFTISGTVRYKTGTLKCISANLVTTTGSKLISNAATTFDTAGTSLIFNDVEFSGTAANTKTMTSQFVASGVFEIITTSGNATFAGTGGIKVQ